MANSPVIWFTGLSGAGKTTIATALHKQLKRASLDCVLLDGDEVRKLSPQLGFSKDDRNQNVENVGARAIELARQGIVVLVSMISPYNLARQKVRELCGSFIEVYVKTPLQICEARDAKGLYAKARMGIITQFTGLDDPYEAPADPELVLDTTYLRVEQNVEKIIEFTGLLSRKTA